MTDSPTRSSTSRVASASTSSPNAQDPRPGLATALTSVRPRGAIVQTGLHTKPATLDAMMLSAKDVSLVGSWCYLHHRLAPHHPAHRLREVPGGQGGNRADPAEDVVPQGFDVLVDPRGDQLKVLASPALTG